jgi:hypothetical protein
VANIALAGPFWLGLLFGCGGLANDTGGLAALKLAIDQLRFRPVDVQRLIVRPA